MIRHAVILNGQVVNVILWDGEDEWSPGAEFEVLPCPDAVSIGWTHDEDGFHEPVVEDPA